MNNILNLLGDANVQFALIGSLLLGIGSAAVGCFAFLRKQSLVGDAVAHAVLPGICLAFMFTGTKNILALLVGAACTAWLALQTIDYLRRSTRLKEDTVIGLTLSVFFGVGILLLTTIQHSDNGNQAGLDKFLFGKAASLVADDIRLFAAIAFVVFIALWLFFKELTIISFDASFARAIGVPVKSVEFVLTILIVISVVAGIQAVGVVLMAAMLITPAATARYWTENLRLMMLLAILSSMIASCAGVMLSAFYPKIPTGPAIVLSAAFLFFLSVAFAPQRGLLARFLRRNAYTRTTLDDNILKALFQLGELDGNFSARRTTAIIRQHRFVPERALVQSLKRLTREGYAERSEQGWLLTTVGRERGARITRLHRLWEVYLTKYLNIASDHVHDDAESVEHIITPELEQRLQEFLDFPERDPHQKQIPYRS